LWLLIGLAAAAVAGVIAAYQFRHAERIYEGVHVRSIPLGGLTLDQAIRAIEEGLTPFSGAAVTLRYGERSWMLTPADLGVSVDSRATALEAFAVGRQGMATHSLWTGLQTDLLDQWDALRAGRAISPTLRYDENRVAFALKRIAREVDQPPSEGALTITGLEVRGVAGSPGRLVDLDATRAALNAVLRAGQGGTIPLVVQERQPSVASVESAAAVATALLGQPLTLTAPTADTVYRFAVDRATLRRWLRLTPKAASTGAMDLNVELDREQVTAYLKEVSAQINRPGRDALLDFDPLAKRVIVLSPSQIGQELDAKAANDAIAAMIHSLAPNPRPAQSAPSSATREITLPVKIILPKVDSNKIAELGIVEQVSEGTTWFAGSSRERVQNIAAAASKFRGVVIPPGAEFSFNRHVGEITAANGFADSLIIWGDRTAVGIGGGVCQVSTTVFRAAFFGGFPITERWAHGYVVSWYGEPGLDATIYTPHVDLRFRNDTGRHLLVKSEVDAAKGRLTFYFYGTKPNRNVEMDKPVTSNVRPPDKPLYQEDPALARGAIQQVEWARNGMDVVVKRKTRYGDGKVVEDEFVSKYQPWRAVFLFGPGTQLREGVIVQPAATPRP